MAIHLDTDMEQLAPAVPAAAQKAVIGVFDSGLGGLSIVRSLRQSLPDESILYFADSAHCPYGEREESFIRARTMTISVDLVQRGAKALVIACNTACAAALEDVRDRVAVPVIGLEPAVKPAAALTRNGRIAVIATPRTIGSNRLARLIERYAPGVVVELIAAPSWVDLVEANDICSARAEAEVSKLVRPAVARGADVLVLGCTHFPFLMPQIRKVAGPQVEIVDSGAAIARRTRHVLDMLDLLAKPEGREPPVAFLTSSHHDRDVHYRASTMLRGSGVALVS